MSRKGYIIQGVYPGEAMVAITTFTEWTGEDMPKSKSVSKASMARPLAPLAHAGDFLSTCT